MTLGERLIQARLASVFGSRRWILPLSMAARVQRTNSLRSTRWTSDQCRARTSLRRIPVPSITSNRSVSRSA